MRIKKKFIHIGLHKTATTYLQNHIFNNIENFELVTRPFTQHNKAFNMMQYADDTMYNENFILKEIEKFKDKNVIFSDEAFSGKMILFSHINRTIIANRLQKLIPDAEIIIFLRDQKTILLSKYLTYLKFTNGFVKLKDFLHLKDKDYSYDDYKKLKKPNSDDMLYNTNFANINIEVFKYSALIELYKKRFKKVHIFIHEDLQHNFDETINRLEKLFGEKINNKKKVQVNSSHSKRKIFLMRSFNKIDYFFQSKLIRKFLHLLINLIHPSFFKEVNSEDEIEKIIKNFFKKDNLKLKKIVKDVDWTKYPNHYRTDD